MLRVPQLKVTNPVGDHGGGGHVEHHEHGVGVRCIHVMWQDWASLQRRHSGWTDVAKVNTLCRTILGS